MINRRLVILVPVLCIILVLWWVWYMLSMKTLAVNYRNVHDVIIYKTATLDSGKAHKPLARVTAPGQELKLRGGGYTLHYVGDNGYESRYVSVDLTRKHQTFSIDPDYSAGKLKELLKAELPSIKAALANKYPGIGIYDVQPGKLYERGEWYGSVMNYKGPYGPNSDSLRVVLHKEDGQWVVKTDPPNITLSKFSFPKVPVNILRDVNSLPVANVAAPVNQSHGSGGAHPRY